MAAAATTVALALVPQPARSSRLLLTTATELKAIMAAAAEGFRDTPRVGSRAPERVCG